MALSGIVPTSAAKYGLDINGQLAGFVRNVQGGISYGEVSKVAHPPSKKIAAVKVSPLGFTTGSRIPKALADHVARNIKEGGPPSDLGLALNILSLTSDEKEFARISIPEAVLCEVDFGTFDLSSKDGFGLDMQLQPNFSQLQPGSGMSLRSPSLPPKAILRSAFRMNGYGHTDIWGGALAVKLPTWSRIPPERTELQALQGQAVTVGTPEIGDLEITFSAPKTLSARQFFNDNLNSANHESNDIVFEALTQDMRQVMFTVTMRRCLAHKLVADDSKSIPTLKMTFFVEDLEVDFGSFAA